MDCKCGYEFILMNYTWRSTPQSPEFTGPKLGPGIRPRVGTINRAPENKFTIIRENFSYYLYYLVLYFSSDLCAAYLDYSTDLTQIFRALAAPIKLVSAITSQFRLPLPVAFRSRRENGGAPLAPSNVSHSIRPPSHLVRPSHLASS